MSTSPAAAQRRPSSPGTTVSHAEKPRAEAPRVGFVSLGCPKATVDSEQILTRLCAEGYAIAPSYTEADLVVVNTCGFIDSAVEESLDAIGEALAENGKVVVTGCLGAREAGEFIRARHPKVLAITGPHDAPGVMDAVHMHLPRRHDPHRDLVPPQGVRLTPRHYAYLKISEGCNHSCSFCIIPALRGKLVSRPIHEVLGEAEKLAAAGVREILVVSQDTSAYGVDLRYRTVFHRGRPLKPHLETLCTELATLGIWVRLHYVYPYPHVDRLLPLLGLSGQARSSSDPSWGGESLAGRRSAKRFSGSPLPQGGVLPYLDIPFQHASPRILKAMKRPASAENVLTRLAHWRSVCPALVIRSTFIVGFPGETEADFAELLDFLSVAQLDRVGCFTYSAVEGASANALPDPVPSTLAEERHARLMAHQAEISARKLQTRIGQTLRVLVDQITAEGAIARSYADAPDIDGIVHCRRPSRGMSPDGIPVHRNGPQGLQVGSWLDVRVDGADTHDLYAEILSGDAG